MNDRATQEPYTIEDLNNVYNTGFETAIEALEKCVGLAPTEQQYLIDHMKEIVKKNRIKYLVSRF